MTKMNIYILLVAAVAALTLVACDKEDKEPDSDVAAAFTATIEEGQTRAYGTFWETGDEIGISYGTGSSGVYNRGHVTQNGDGKFTIINPAEQIYYTSSSLTFKAYYPYKYIENPSSNNRTINGNTSEQKNQKNFDFLYASATGSKVNPEVEFKFGHKMSKLTFVFKSGMGMDVSNITSYTLDGFVMDGTFIIDTGSCGGKSTGTVSPVKVDLAEVKDNVETTPCILFPQTAKTTPTIKITDRNNQEYTCNLTFSNSTTASIQKKIETGKNYKFTITVNKSGLVVSDFTITDWNDYKWPEGGGQGTATSDDDPDEE